MLLQYGAKDDGHIVDVGVHGTDCILMQSSGVEDCDGVEIFEGDLLTCCYDRRHTDLVIFENGKFTGQLFELHQDAGTARKWKVIGNKYQNQKQAEELGSWELPKSTCPTARADKP